MKTDSQNSQISRGTFQTIRGEFLSPAGNWKNWHNDADNYRFVTTKSYSQPLNCRTCQQIRLDDPWTDVGKEASRFRQQLAEESVWPFDRTTAERLLWSSSPIRQLQLGSETKRNNQLAVGIMPAQRCDE
jgi:hypothetical protein